MNFGYTTIYVKDVKETVDFYQKAFELKLKYMSEGAEFAAMDTGETILSFVSEEFMKSTGIAFKENTLNETPAGFEIALIADDVDKSFEKAVMGGATIKSSPVQKPWGQRVGYLLDNNGVLVEICSKMDF